MKDTRNTRSWKHTMLVFELGDVLLITPAKYLCLNGAGPSATGTKYPFLYVDACNLDYTVPFSE